MTKRATLTNFRAEDFGGKSKSSAPAKKAAAAPAPEPEPQEDGVPEGTIKEIQTWVGDDEDKAAQALAVENQKEKPRSSLVEWLENVGNEDDNE